MYGGRDYLERQLNDATQSIAQAGSTFKPFALVSALEQGIPLTSMWNGDSPQTFDDAGKPYEVFNYGNEGWGQTDLMNATRHSINTIFVPLGIKVGPTNVADVARRHHACGVLLRKFRRGENRRSHVWYRWFNELPVLLLLAAVVLVVVKPF
jgi:membrane peptidoglycan carboxypeptidase